MKVYFHPTFYEIYTHDPAAAAGRVEAVVDALEGFATFVEPRPATESELLAAHDASHVRGVRAKGLYHIAALAAGATVQAAETGLTEPGFALVRPPGHHASRASAWGFCYFNNIAVALLSLKARGRIARAFVLDFDLHYGDGTVDILGDGSWVQILNPTANDRGRYLAEVGSALSAFEGDIIGVSAGFDHHIRDWGGLLTTEDYQEMGKTVRNAARRTGAGCFGVLEGGYNAKVLGLNVRAFLEGMAEAG